MCGNLLLEKDDVDVWSLAEKHLLLLFRCLTYDGHTPAEAEMVLAEIFLHLKNQPDAWNHNEKASVQLVRIARSFSNNPVKKSIPIKAI